jgi:dipeptidase E
MIYVGLSAGSMVASPNFGGENYGGINLPIEDDSGLGRVDFSLFPHLDHESFPENSLANAEIWAAKIPLPTYAIDDQTAIKVSDGAVEVISEGHWKLFTR